MPERGDGEMPKEIVRSSTHSVFDVAIRWGRDSNDVQIATALAPDSTFDLKALVDGWYENPETRPETVGLWADLTRSDINRLIRLLRKARDTAFGADA